MLNDSIREVENSTTQGTCAVCNISANVAAISRMILQEYKVHDVDGDICMGILAYGVYTALSRVCGENTCGLSMTSVKKSRCISLAISWRMQNASGSDVTTVDTDELSTCAAIHIGITQTDR